MGVLAGCGRQAVNAKVGLASSYIFGLPTAFLFCFASGMGVMGLWLGLAIGQCVRALSLLYLCFWSQRGSDWEALSRLAKARACR